MDMEVSLINVFFALIRVLRGKTRFEILSGFFNCLSDLVLRADRVMIVTLAPT